MKVLLCSDTHASQGYITLLREKINAFNPDYLIHLGDDYNDVPQLMAPEYQTIRIPGTWCPAYQDPMIENRCMEEIEGWAFFLTHTPNADRHDLPSDPKPESVLEERSCDIFCHGHTHHPICEQKDGVWILNPGHLKEKDNRGFPPTYAELLVSSEEIEIQIKGLLDSSVAPFQTISQTITRHIN